MRLGAGLRAGRFRRRLNRFTAEVEVGGEAVAAHLPNSGRLAELLVPGAAVTLAAARPGRRTAYDLVAVRHRGVRVCVDARLPGPLLAEAVAAGRLPGLRGWRVLAREVRLGESRLDLLLADPAGRPVYGETKSVTLVRDGVGLFPDAPTARGRRHLQELAAAVAAGGRGVAVFVVQREDAACWRPNDATDPAFGAAVRAAAAAGVAVLAVRCRVTRTAVAVLDEIPALL